MRSLPMDDQDAPLYTVGQVADMLDVQQAFLRRLDEHDVVRPARSAGGQRRYTRGEIILLQRACAYIREGVTLSGVRRVLALERRIAQLEAELGRRASSDRVERDVEQAAGGPGAASARGRGQ